MTQMSYDTIRYWAGTTSTRARQAPTARRCTGVVAQQLGNPPSRRAAGAGDTLSRVYDHDRRFNESVAEVRLDLRFIL